MARSITGTVSSNTNDKTITITVTERKTHPLYKKQYTRNTKFMAHDEKNEAKVGDLVTITECRPLSARKHFTLTKVVERGGIKFQEADATSDIPEPEQEVPADKPVEEAAKKPAAKPKTKPKEAV